MPPHEHINLAAFKMHLDHLPPYNLPTLLYCVSTTSSTPTSSPILSPIAQDSDPNPDSESTEPRVLAKLQHGHKFRRSLKTHLKPSLSPWITVFIDNDDALKHRKRKEEEFETMKKEFEMRKEKFEIKRIDTRVLMEEGRTVVRSPFKGGWGDDQEESTCFILHNIPGSAVVSNGDRAGAVEVEVEAEGESGGVSQASEERDGEKKEDTSQRLTPKVTHTLDEDISVVAVTDPYKYHVRSIILKSHSPRTFGTGPEQKKEMGYLVEWQPQWIAESDIYPLGVLETYKKRVEAWNGAIPKKGGEGKAKAMKKTAKEIIFEEVGRDGKVLYLVDFEEDLKPEWKDKRGVLKLLPDWETKKFEWSIIEKEDGENAEEGAEDDEADE